MAVCNLSPPRSLKIHHQQSLTLLWHSFPRWGREHYTVSCSYNCSQYFVHNCLQLVTAQFTQDTWPTVLDALLTLIVNMGQGRYCNLFYLSGRPIIPVWLSSTYWRCDYPGRRSGRSLMLRWRSVDAHFQDEVGSVLISFLQIKAANTLILYNLKPNQLWITRLTWPTIANCPLMFFLPCLYPQYGIIWFGIVYHSQCLPAFLAFSFSFSLITTLCLNNTYKYIP